MGVERREEVRSGAVRTEGDQIVPGLFEGMLDREWIAGVGRSSLEKEGVGGGDARSSRWGREMFNRLQGRSSR